MRTENFKQNLRFYREFLVFLYKKKSIFKSTKVIKQITYMQKAPHFKSKSLFGRMKRPIENSKFHCAEQNVCEKTKAATHRKLNGNVFLGNEEIKAAAASAYDEQSERTHT